MPKLSRANVCTVPHLQAVVVTDPETAVRLLKEERLPKFSRSYVNFRKVRSSQTDVQ